MTSVPELMAQKRKVHEVFSKADAALHKGTVTQEQRDAVLRSYFGSSVERDVIATIDERIGELREEGPLNRSVALIAGFCVVMVTLFATLFFSTGGITGAVVLDITEVNQTYSAADTVPLLLNSTTRINVSGTAQGAGDVTVTLLHDGARFTLYSYRHGMISTAHASMRAHYASGETVTFTATNVSSAYLLAEDDTVLLNGTAIEGLPDGSYTLKLIISDAELSQEQLPFTVGGALPEEEFNSCGDACSTNLSGNATLEINVSNATLALWQVILSTQENSAPLLVRSVPDATGTGSAVIDLSGVFADADGDALTYSSTDHDENNESFNSTHFIVSGPAGTYTYIVYASDLMDLTPSNIFSVTLESPAAAHTTDSQNSTNTTQPDTNIAVNQTNTTNGTTATANTTTNLTANSTTNITTPANSTGSTVDALDCSNPDPNQRPADCLNMDAAKFFEEDIFLESIDRVQVARITPIGNVLITGRVHKRSAAQPASNDYTIGYKDGDFQYVPTIWISTATGDLHLQGTLYEENANLVPPAGSFAIINRRGVYMAYADPQTGDLYVRGNVIPFRESIYE